MAGPIPPSLAPIAPGGRIRKSRLKAAAPFLKTSTRILTRGIIAITTKPNNKTVIKLFTIFLFLEFFTTYSWTTDL
jgi:hypothetical protein